MKLPASPRPASAALIAIAAVSPPIVSAMGKPVRIGALSPSPVIDIAPDSP